MNLENVRLSAPQQHKWFKNALVFLIPIATTYLGSLGFILSQEGHVLTFRDFIPNLVVIGGIVYYLQSILIDYGKKLKG